MLNFPGFSSQSSDPFMDHGSSHWDLDEQLAVVNITRDTRVIFLTTFFVHMIYVTSVTTYDTD